MFKMGLATGIETKSVGHGDFKTTSNLMLTAVEYDVGLEYVPTAIVGIVAGTGASI